MQIRLSLFHLYEKVVPLGSAFSCLTHLLSPDWDWFLEILDWIFSFWIFLTFLSHLQPPQPDLWVNSSSSLTAIPLSRNTAPAPTAGPSPGLRASSPGGQADLSTSRPFRPPQWSQPPGPRVPVKGPVLGSPAASLFRPPLRSVYIWQSNLLQISLVIILLLLSLRSTTVFIYGARWIFSRRVFTAVP